MATTNAFRSKTKSAVGTTYVDVYTVPANTATVLIGLNLACMATSSIVADVFINKATGDDVYLVKTIPIPTGASFEVLSGQKITLEVGDKVQVRCDTSAGMDVIMSFLDIITI